MTQIPPFSEPGDGSEGSGGREFGTSGGGIPPVSGQASDYYYEPPPHPAWIKVVGIISIVLGSLGILTYSCGLIGGLLTGMFADMAMQAPGNGAGIYEAQMQVTEHYMVATSISQGIGLLLAVLLLAAGIATLRRRRWARQGSLIWAALKALHALGASALGYIVNRDMMDAMDAAMAGDPSMQGGVAMGGMMGMMQGFGVVMMVISALFMLAYPVFIVIWFNRAKVVAEVQTWE